MLARLSELPLLVVLLGVSGALAFVPAIHGLAVSDYAVARDFFYSALILLIIAAMLGMATAAYSPRDPAQSHLASLVGAYLVLPFAMLLPWLQALPDTTFVNAWFEMTASFTTTGATGYAADRLSDTLHLWRAIVGWYGGFLILLAAYAILAPLSLGGFEVASGRVPGRRASALTQAQRVAEPAQRLSRWAVRLLPVYSGLTLILWVGLMITGEGATTALIHSMGTLSTSGISGQSGLAGGGFPAELVVFLFFLFSLSRRALPAPGFAAAPGTLLTDPELRLAMQILGVVTLTLFFRHWFVADSTGDGDAAVDALSALWGILFTATSFLTTTGYVSADWQAAAAWSSVNSLGMILLGLAIFGGGIATTAGGVKLLRIFALLRHGGRELERIVHPSSVGGGGTEGRRLYQEGAQLAWVFFMLFAISLALLTGLLTLMGVSFEQALVLSIAALTTTGQLADLGAPEPIIYSTLASPVKLALGLAMILGRLETLALLACVLPARGRR